MVKLESQRHVDPPGGGEISPTRLSVRFSGPLKCFIKARTPSGIFYTPAPFVFLTILIYVKNY
jgi:hypothetical protein